MPYEIRPRSILDASTTGLGQNPRCSLPSAVTFDSHRERFIIGDPDHCIREIERYQRELGMDYLICWMHYPGADHQKTLRAMRLLAKEVMPHFRDK